MSTFFDISLAESDPLLEQNPLQDNLTDILDAHLQDPHRKLRIALKTTSVLVSATAKAPFWVINMQLGPILGPICGAANLGGFFVLESWAAWKGLDAALGPKTPQERHRKTHPCRNSILITTASLLAAFSQAPSALAAVDYNDPSLKITAGIVVILAGSLFPLRSMQLSLKATSSLFLCEFETHLHEARLEAISLLRSHLQEDLREQASSPTYLQYLLTQKSISTLSETPRQIGEGLGFLLNIFFQASIGAYTYKKSQEYLIDDKAFGAALTFCTVTTSCYLIATSVQRTAGRVFQGMYSYFTHKHEPTLVERLRPKLLFALKTAGFFTSVFGSGATLVIWSQFYDETLPTQVLATTGMCTTIFFLLFTAMTDTIESLTQDLLLLKGTQEEKEILELHATLTRLIQALEEAPLEHFALFLKHLPQETTNPILTKYALLRDDLEEYISTNS